MSTMTDDTTFTAEYVKPAARPQRQLSFDVGHAGGTPDLASLKIAGSFGVGEDLKRQSVVHVCVTDQNGEVIVESDATITAVGFKDSVDQHGNVSTERSHTATLGVIG